MSCNRLLEGINKLNCVFEAGELSFLSFKYTRYLFCYWEGGAEKRERRFEKKDTWFFFFFSIERQISKICMHFLVQSGSISFENMLSRLRQTAKIIRSQ